MVTWLMGDGKAMQVLFQDIKRSFDPVPERILLEQESRCEMSRDRVCRVKNGLMYWFSMG